MISDPDIYRDAGAAKPRPALSDDETKRRLLAAHIVQATQKAQRTA